MRLFASNAKLEISLVAFYGPSNPVAGKLDRADNYLGKGDFPMERIFKVGDRVYHLRKGDSLATEGYGAVLEVGTTRLTILWEHNGKRGSVERRDIMTQIEATEAGF